MNINKKVAAGIGLIAGALGLYLWTKKAKPCTEGAKKCVGADLYTCINGKWVLTEANSPTCVTPPSCSVDTDCPAGFVCQNGVCVSQLVTQYEIYGVVTDIETHIPIPSATITITETGDSTTSDAQGQYRISCVTNAYAITVTFSAEGYAAREYGLTLGGTGGEKELNAALVRKEIAQATLYGTVTDDKGNPVEGATLKIYFPWYAPSQPFTATIGSSYSISAVDPGTYRITVEKPGYATWDNMVTVIGGEPNELNIVLTQVWDWEGIYQISDYLRIWQELANTQGMGAVLDTIYQIPGMPPHEQVSIYDPQPFNFYEIVENHLPEYIIGWARLPLTHAYYRYYPPAGYHETSEVYNPSPPEWPYYIPVKVRCDQNPIGWWPFVPTRNPYEGFEACVNNGECYSVPSIGGIDQIIPTLSTVDAIPNLKYICVYAECKRHGSAASSFYQFWEYLKVREYGPGCPGTHCQVEGYIFYDSYGSGIGWDVGYRWDRWPNPYKTGELLHYV